jgi:hypothetical protein
MIRRLILTLLFLAGIAACAAFVAWAQESSITRPPVQYRASDLRDPFDNNLPKKAGVTGDTKSGPPALTVSGVLWGGSIPQAIINDKVVKVGDKIEKAEVISISKEGVSVLYGEQEYTINSPAVTAVKETKKDEAKGGKDEK